MGSDTGIQIFLESLAQLYVNTCNIVFLYNPKVASTNPASLDVDIDDAYCDVNKTHGKKLFKRYWNEACALSHPNACITGEVIKEEWRWVISPLMQSCREAVATVLREQLDKDHLPVNKYPAEDLSDLAKAFYCGGAIWRAVLVTFVRSDRIKSGMLTRAHSHVLTL